MELLVLILMLYVWQMHRKIDDLGAQLKSVLEKGDEDEN